MVTQLLMSQMEEHEASVVSVELEAKSPRTHTDPHRLTSHDNNTQGGDMFESSGSGVSLKRRGVSGH